MSEYGAGEEAANFKAPHSNNRQVGSDTVPDTETLLLKKKYNLHKAPEVGSAVVRTQVKIGESLPNDPLVHIQNYLNRFHEITDREDPDKREHGVDAIKRLLYRNYVIKPNEIPEAYWETQRRIIRERGQGADLEQMNWEKFKIQNTEGIIADQRASLDKWIDYLSSPDAPYSDSLKYFTLRSVLTMGEYNKEKLAFPQRSRGTTKPFPDLNREALAYVLDAIEKKYKGQQIDTSTLEQKDQAQFEKLLQGENFAKLYALAIEKVTPTDAQRLAIIDGQWIKYNQGTDHMPLVASLQGHGTGWCTAGESTAQKQLQGGDFYVYYSNDVQGEPTVPRVAIRMEGANIGEVRGIAPEQNLDPYIGPVVESKLEEFPDRKAYQKKVSDMKQLTEIEHKMHEGISLDASELVFLYEVDSPIKGFGFSSDPRIEELRRQRNPEEDLLSIFNCDPSQIAHVQSEITPDTKAYVGSLSPGIFDRLSNAHVEHIYTSFPEGKIRIQSIEIGGENTEHLQRKLEQTGISVTPRAQNILRSDDFTPLPTSQLVNTVRVKAKTLGIHNYSTTDQVYTVAQELGLTLCPAEVGPRYLLQQKDQLLEGESMKIGMKQIADSDGHNLLIFSINHDEGTWRLTAPIASGDGDWRPKDEFLFSLRNHTE